MYRIAAALGAGMIAMATPAQACVYSPPINLEDVRHAEIVVVGRLVNYRIVEDQEARRDRRLLEARWPGRSLREQQRRARHTRFLSDYAQFDVVVEEVLVGRPRQVLTVRWQNSTFGEPDSMPAGRYLVALRRTNRVEPDMMEPVQSSCSTAFIFEAPSRQAGEVRAILSRR